MTRRPVQIDLGTIIAYGRDCLGIRQPDALSRFVAVIQMVEHEMLER